MKRFYIILSAILLFLIIALLTGLPFYAKYYINKNGKELTGRQLHLDGLVFNALNGHLTLRDFTVFEKDDSTPFVSFDTLYANLEIYKLFSSELYIEEIRISHPVIYLQLEAEVFNFDDLIPPPDSSDQNEVKKEITKYTFNNIAIKRGYIDYKHLDIKAEHTIKDLNIEIPGISWGKDKADAGLLFALDKGGRFQTDFHFDKATNYFNWNLEVIELNLKNALPYIKNSVNVKDVNGNLDGYISVFGVLDSIDASDFVTRINVHDFSLIDHNDDDFIGFKQLEILSDTLNATKLKFHLDSITLISPYITYIIDKDSISNFDKILDLGSADSDSISGDTSLAQLSYYVNHIRISDGKVNYKDETLSPENFNYTLSEIEFEAEKVKEGNYVNFLFSSLLNESGKFKGDVHFDPIDPGNGEFNLAFKDLEIKDFTPFTLSYFAYPLSNGRLNFNIKNKIKNRYLNSHIAVDLFAAELGEKNKNYSPAYNVPLKLALVVMRDPKGRINFDVPAEGDMNNPDFKYRKIIFKVLLNVIVKAAISPYNLLAQSIGSDEESIKKIRLDKGQDLIGPEQSSQLDLIAKLLSEKQGLEAKVTLHVDEENEKEFLLIRNAKREYYTFLASANDISKIQYDEADWAIINSIESDDPEFISFLQNKTQLLNENEIKALSQSLLSDNSLTIQFNELNENRIEMLTAYLQQKHDSIPILIGSKWIDEKKVGKPYYLLEYEVSE